MKKSKTIKQNVGIDISKDDFRVCFYALSEDGKRRIKGSRKFKNSLSGFKEFLKWVEKHCRDEAPLFFTMEATGVYHEQLAHFLDDKKMSISVILPNKFKAYVKSLNVLTKTDKSDAKYLGQMGLERNLLLWKPASPNILSLKQLTRDRVSLLKERTVVKNKIHALSHSFHPNRQVLKRLRQREKLLTKQLNEVENQIEDSVKSDDFLWERVEKICEVKGLGIITIATIIAETGGFKLFTSRSQLVSYAGYDVIEKESGTSVKGNPKISKKGNRFIRRALYFPAISTVKHEPQFQQTYERIVVKTTIKKKALVAVQRKLLLLIYALFTKNEAYDVKYAEKKKKQENQNEENCRQELNPAYSG